MQELITEFAIYLGIAAFLGLVLGYLIWGMGFRRRIEAARADGAAAVRTSVDGDSSLRAQVDQITRERDRLEHRVEVLSASLASAREADDGRTAATATEEELGTVHLDVNAAEEQMEAAAAAFPRPGETTARGPSIFDVSEEADREETAADVRAEAPGSGNDALGDEGAAHSEPDDDPSLTSPKIVDDQPARSDPVSDEAVEDESSRRRLLDAAATLRPGLPEDPAPETAEDEDADETLNGALDRADEPSPPDNAPDEDAVAEAGVDNNSVPDHDPDSEPASATSPAAAPDASDLAEIPGKADDLTKIKGIGKATSKALNSQGIVQFRQLADLSASEVEDLRTALSPQMAKSIQKWVDQARDLAG